jgi:hypothetical protein
MRLKRAGFEFLQEPNGSLSRAVSADKKRKGEQEKPEKRLPVDLEAKAQNIEAVNAVVSEEYQIEDEELEQFAKENYLQEDSKAACMKLLKNKMINRLIEQKVKVNHLAMIVIYRLFLKYSELAPNYQNTKTVSAKGFLALLDELGEILSPFEEIYAHINSDIKKLRTFHETQNISEEQLHYVNFISRVQKYAIESNQVPLVFRPSQGSPDNDQPWVLRFTGGGVPAARRQDESRPRRSQKQKQKKSPENL